MSPHTLTFVTGNADKLADVRGYLGPSISLDSVALHLPELQGTVDDIARDKCRRAADILKRPVLVDDTSLRFIALGDMPGPYIKWFFEELGNENLHKMVAGFDDNSAQIICTFAYSPGAGHEPVLFQERTDGKIVPPRGPPVFGWNPAFEYEGRTFAEMTKEEKSKISGRKRALDRLQAWLKESTKVED